MEAVVNVSHKLNSMQTPSVVYGVAAGFSPIPPTFQDDLKRVRRFLIDLKYN